MKISLSLVVMFLSVAFAQTAPKGAAQRATVRRKMPGGERTMKGCLLKDNAGAYELQTAHGRKVKLSSSEDLAPQVGHQVKLSGAFIDAPNPADPVHEGSAAKRLPGDPKGRHSGVREFQVVKVEAVANTCSVASGTHTK
jgi:hypothetical protein